MQDCKYHVVITTYVLLSNCFTRGYVRYIYNIVN